MTVTISRLYDSHRQATQAARELEAAGVDRDDISIIANNADDRYASAQDFGTYPDRDLDGRDDRLEAAATGAEVGAVIGGAAGLLAGLGVIAIPGIGPVVAAGWLVSTLAGATAVGAAGSIIGALTQVGISRDEAEVYAEGLRRGGAIVSARVADADAVRLQAIMDRSGVPVTDRAEAYRKGGWRSFDPQATPYTAEQVRKERELYR